MSWLRPEAVFDGECLRPGWGLRIENGQVAELSDTPPEDARAVPGIIAPGFVDLQVNGGGGVLLNGDPTPDGTAAILDAHRALGTVALLPTVITDRPEVLDAATDAAIAARDLPGLLGLHLEGPHLSEAKRGTHAARHLAPWDDRMLDRIDRLRAAGLAVMVTVAPEIVPPEAIAAMARTGAVVSIGHTNADAATVQRAIEAGARAATHLFNAMSQMTAREPGAVGAVIGSRLAAGIICDGHHVADEMIALALRARPVPDTTFLVSDAMATVGGPDRFRLYGQQITLRDGRLVNAEGALAGAHLCMAWALARAVDAVGIDRQEALRMAITVPARVVGRPELARLQGRTLRDLVHLSPDLRTVAAVPAA